MEDTDEVLEKIKAIMAEHSMNYAFSIIDEEGYLRYDYSNWRVARMLITDSLMDMNMEIAMEGFNWDDDEEDED